MAWLKTRESLRRLSIGLKEPGLGNGRTHLHPVSTYRSFSLTIERSRCGFLEGAESKIQMKNDDNMLQPELLSVAGTRQQILAPEQKILAPEQEILVPGGAFAADRKVHIPKRPFRYDCRRFKRYLDWRSFYPKDKIRKIYDQHHLPNCWAYATASSLEWMHLLNTGEYIPVSIQQLTDCDTDDVSNGYAALKRVLKTGVASADNYPFVDGLRGKLKHIDPIIRVKDITGWNRLDRFNYLRLIEMLQNGLVIVCVRIEDDMFGEDEHNINLPGIFRYPVYGVPNHEMVCVGYDFRAEPHWILQNSWNEEHANNGYLHYGQREYPKFDDQFGCFPFICFYPIEGKFRSRMRSNRKSRSRQE